MVVIWSAFDIFRAVQLILAIALSGPAYTHLFRWLRRSDLSKSTFNGGQQYQDEDGEASKESLQSFSDRLPRALFATHAFIGSLACFGLIVVGSYHGTSLNGLSRFGIWINLMLQSVALFTESSSPRRFRLALFGSINCINATCALFLGLYAGSSGWRILGNRERILIAVELLSAVVACMSGLLLPRRPDVFWKGILVDRLFTKSASSIIFFSWSRSALRNFLTEQSPKIYNLPQLNHTIRALHLLQRFYEYKSLRSDDRSLWRDMFSTNSQQLVVQLSMTIFGSVISFAPQMMLLGILRTLERDSDTESKFITTAPWVLGLGLSIICTALMDAGTVWVSSVNLGVKMQKQLTMLLFDKMLRGVSMALEEYDNEDGSEMTDPASLNIISLVTLDTQQIGNCIRDVYRGYEAVIKLIISGWFIQQLMGWQSLLASIILIVLLFSGNVLIAKQHARDQIDLMEEKDLRVAALTDALGGVRQIKLSGAEQHWSTYITRQREKELASLWAVNRWNMASGAIWTMTPILLSVLVISIHAYLTGQLKASTAFTSLSILSSINSTLGAIPQLQTGWIRALNSLERLEDYLYASDKCFPSTNHDEISLLNATVCWNGSNPDVFSLRDMTLSFPSAGISVIEGPSGSGKSLLLAAVLGECELVAGNITKPSVTAHTPAFAGRSWPLNSSIAYVGQAPWIEAGTIMDNITFGFPMQARRFNKVIHACALETDLAAFKDGDQTEIGPHGVNLSGGQRLRITLARALYSPASILVLDDIFSAIDAHTALHIAENVLGGSIVQGRTVILASHHPSLYMPYADYIVSLSSGGQYECRFTERCGRAQPHETTYITNEMVPRRRRASTKTAASRHARKASVISVASIEPFPINESTDVVEVYRYVEEEQEQTSGSQHKTLIEYLQCMGNAWYLLFALLAYVSYVLMIVGQSWWIARWVQQDEHATHNSPTAWHENEPSLVWYLGIYVAFALASCVFGVGQNYLTYYCTLNASRRLFDMLLNAVLLAPMDFTERNPLGRIMNRFTSDTAILDEQIGQILGGALTSALMLLAIFGVSTTVSKWILPMSIPMLLLCAYTAKQFLRVARKLKHLDNISRSPVLESFCSAMDGLPTIRSMLLQERYTTKFATLVDDNTRALLNLWLINSWFGCRMALIGSAFVTMASLVIVSMPGITVAMTGFALGFLLRYTDTICTFIRNFGSLEIALTSTSRVLEYTQIPSENYSGGRMPPAAWPEEGRVQVSDLVIRHAPHLPPALNRISFDIGPNERVGVVGRTGAGKSTLAMAFFRILEAEQGSITLDGINVAEVTLQQLRQRLSIITQDPHLFPGTVRSNLDPFSVHDDTDLLHALGRVHWPGSDDWFSEQADMVSGMGLFSDADSVVLSHHEATPAIPGPPLLDQPILNGGENLSQGQRQQLSLARAIVDRSKLLILDEATSSMDPDTDAAIQKSIRELSTCGFASMLVIAHRISTVMDFDKIIVLEKGAVVESGCPEDLLRLPGGYFRSLVEDSRGTDE